MWWMVVAALAAEPEVHVTWKGAQSLLLVRPGAGEHLAPDAPFDVELAVGDRSVLLNTLGDDAAEGVPLGDVRSQLVQGVVRFSVCEDAGSRCRLIDAAVVGTISDARRGMAMLAAREAEAALPPEGFPARVNAEQVYQRALADARARGLPLLLDFGAVWCPPCQRMDAELFLTSPRPSVVDAFVVARLDVDDPSSWALKDRYDVTGYPTVLAVDLDGKVLGRQIGYQNVDATVAWLDGIATGRAHAAAGDPTPAAAGELAWTAVQEDRLDDARRWVAVGAADPDRMALRLARFHLNPTADDAVWLADRAPGFALAWVGALGDLRGDATVQAAAKRAIEHDLVSARPAEGADLLYYAAGLASDPAEARSLYAAGAALLRARLTGIPLSDKGYLHDLATLTERAGHPDEAAKLLREAAATWPNEPTFWYSLAGLELRQEHAEEALVAADRALEHAWGDNRLTAAIARTEALVKLNRVDEARRFVAAVLAEAPAPAAGVDVRTHRYRQQLQAALPTP